MTFTSDFYDYLVADAEIAAAVGTDDNSVAKVYHQHVPEGEDPPFVVFLKVAGSNHHHATGSSAIADALIQIDCVGMSNTTDAETIAEAVRNRIDGIAGTIGSTDVASLRVLSSRELVEDVGDGGENWLSRVILEVEAWYVQTAPTG